MDCACFRHISTTGFREMGHFSAFSAIMHGIGTIPGGNTDLCDGKSGRRTMYGSVTCWFPWKHPLAWWLGAIQNLARYRCPTNWPHPKFRLGPSGLDLRPCGPQHNNCATSARPFGPRLSGSPRRYAPRNFALSPSPPRHCTRRRFSRASRPSQRVARAPQRLWSRWV